MSTESMRWLGGLFAVVAAVSVVRILLPARPKLSTRLRPYASISRSALGQMPDISGVIAVSGSRPGASSIERILQPITETLVRWLTGFTGQQNQEQLALKLRQAGIGLDISDSQRVHDYRVRQITQIMIMAGAAIVFSLAIRPSPGFGLIIFGAGCAIGATREPAKLSKTVETRRARMRIELYTINQQLAMNLRTGGSSIQAVQRIVRRSQGEVAAELREALRLHERGMTASKAFERISEYTPEPFAARMYKMLAAGAERGADLAEGLLALSLDVREERRDAMKRSATRRRGLMIIPTVGLMAPTLLLFIAAPIPSMILGTKR